MKYETLLTPRALKDLRKIPEREALRIAKALRRLEDNLSGDVKKLTNFNPFYRLRVGDFRILFDVERNTVIVRRIAHRRDVYDS